MPRTCVHLEWESKKSREGFHTGVSLHSHTHCSRESLSFICRIAARVGLIDAALRRSRRRHGAGLDLSRGWWTPPLVPSAAWDLESAQIETRLGLDALISLTDHDTIEAPLLLQHQRPRRETPISVEWTVPFGGTFFHLGVHNLKEGLAGYAMDEMAAYTTRREQASRLADLLDWIASDPGTLIVLNHPVWDENEIGQPRHDEAVQQLLRLHTGAIHALEMNGLRPWGENLRAAGLAKAWGKPLVAGGDRHGLEPNSLLNLSRACTFAEFVQEVRYDAQSDILVTGQYRQSLSWRMFDAVLEAVADYESHGLGWTYWNDRFFYHCDDGIIRSLREIFGDRPPGILHNFTLLARALYRSRLQNVMRTVMARPQEVTL